VRRVATKPYVVPGTGGRGTIEPDSLIVVPVHELHHDAEHFPEPEKFQPHRFPGQLSSAYMPHGSGPQSYIGKYAKQYRTKFYDLLLDSSKDNSRWILHRYMTIIIISNDNTKSVRRRCHVPSTFQKVLFKYQLNKQYH